MAAESSSAPPTVGTTSQEETSRRRIIGKRSLDELRAGDDVPMAPDIATNGHEEDPETKRARLVEELMALQKDEDDEWVCMEDVVH